MDRLDPKADGSTPNIVEQNIEALRRLFPDAFTEGSDEQGPRWKVDIEALRELLGAYVDDRQERYSFVWNGKARARRIAQTPSTGTLRPFPAESVNWDTTQNLFIEGDNLEVLKLLQKSYHKRVKMIYIDPPYNTGKDFIYPDNFRDSISTYKELTGQLDEKGRSLSANAETSGRYHTNWLNMMYPRMKLARNLLLDDGVAFISIDDCELANLRKLCDEVFGEENFIANIIWQKRTSPDMRTAISEGHDNILVYARRIGNAVASLQKLPLTEEQRDRYTNPDNDPRGPWVSSDFTAQGYRPNQMYEITTPGGATYAPPDGRCWKNVEEVFLRQVEEGRFWFGADGKGVPRRKTYLSESTGRVPWTWWPNREVGHTQEAKKEVNALFEKAEVFPTPKPTRLISRMMELATSSPDDIVLDFFAGSCATAHAAIEHSRKHGRRLRFIMVQLPEPCEKGSAAYEAGYFTIADIGKERIRRVIKQIDTDQEQKAKNAERELPGTTEEIPELDTGFKVFKLDASNIKPWDADFDNLETALFDSVENVKTDRTESDVLYELLLKYGLDLAVPIEERQAGGKTAYIIGAGALIVCLADKVGLDTVEGIAAMRDELKPEVMRVVFKDAGFADDVVKTNAVQILRQAGVEDVKSL